MFRVVELLAGGVVPEVDAPEEGLVGWTAAGVGGAPSIGPNCWSLGIGVQLYWNSGTVGSSPVRNL